MSDGDKLNGFVKWFDAKKGYGFIQVIDGADGDEDVFVHYSNIEMDGFRKLDQGDEVEFVLQKNENDKKGPEALDVKIVAKDRRF
ncbi:MAG: Cold shock-like protein [Promethearchaeota archaeon]|nr:MAG: Cold shock-like protein [Candidatus Lokiarchaeota archaeon]